MKKLSLVSSFVLMLAVCVSDAATTYRLGSLFNFGSTASPARFDGSIQPGDNIGTSPQTGLPVYITGVPAQSPVPGALTNTWNPGETTNDVRTTGSTNGFNDRGITYDPVSGNVLFVDTHSGSGGSNSLTPWTAIYVMDGDTAAIKAVLNTNGITGGSYTVVVPGVSDDGVVYVCNQTTASQNNIFKIYRWDTAATNNPNFGQPPVVAYSGFISNNIGISSERLGQTMDVRGSGPNTQILLGSSSLNGDGKSMYLFTTPDGTNFYPTRIAFTNITTAQFNDGVAWGPGNTFFTKQVGKPINYLAFNGTLVGNTNGFGTNSAGLNPFSGSLQITGTVVSAFAAVSINDPLLNLSAIAYDPNRKLLAGLEEIGGIATGGRGKVWLFDIADPTNRAPAVLDSRTYGPNYQKTVAPMGYLRFRYGTNLYAQASNNGFLCSSVDTVNLNAPTFSTDLPSQTRVPIAANIHMEVFAVVDVTGYQWYSNNVAIPGATSYFYDIPNVTTNLTGAQFYVVVTNAAGSASSTVSTINVVDPAQFFHPTLLWSVAAAANTVLLNNPTNFISTSGSGSGSPNERCIAYNALSNQLLVVRGPAAYGSLKIMVIDADRGTNGYLYTLKTNGLAASSTLQLCGIGVADDGAVYAASVDNANNNANDQSFKVFRWANTDSNTLPVQIFGTNCPASNNVAFPYNPISDLNGGITYRFGDNLTVRGSGQNTEILIDSQQNTTYASILTPVDSTGTNWTQSGFVLQNKIGSYGSSAYGTSVGRGLQFGTGNTFYQKRYNGITGSPLALMSYNPGGGLALLQTPNNSPVLLTNAVVAVNTTLKLAAGFNLLAGTGATAPTSQIDLYDLTEPAQAVLLGIQTFPGGNAGAHLQNANAIAQMIFGVNPATGTNYLFAIEGNNGVAAYVLSGGTVPPPGIAQQPSNLRIIEKSSGSLQAIADQIVNFTWFKGTNPAVNTGVTGSTFNITNASAANSGDYFCIISNQFGMNTSRVAHVSIGLTNDNYTLFQRWVAAPGATNYVTSNGGANTPTEREFAYNAASNQIIMVSCVPSVATYHLFVINADTGQFLYEMNTNGVVHEGASEVSGSNPIDLVGAGASDDGNIYVCNESPNGSGGSSLDPTKMFHLYRWTNSAPTTPAVPVFVADPASLGSAFNERWGDSMCVRGSGTNTEIFVNSQSGTYGAVLKPTDASLNTFTNYWFFDVAGAGGIGRSVQFATGSQVYEKRKSNPLVLSSYDTNLNSAAILLQSPSSATLGGVWVDTVHNLAMGVDFVGSGGSPPAPDAVSLYDITDPSTPMFIRSYNFGANQTANANAICETIVSGNHGWALDGNNGLLAFTIVPPINTVHYSITSATNSGANVTLTWSSTAGFKYQVKSSTDVTLPISSWSNVGSVVNAADPGTNTSTIVPAPAAAANYRVQIVP